MKLKSKKIPQTIKQDTDEHNLILVQLMKKKSTDFSD